jgi:Zn-finger nucleic acid-binding protein
MNLACLKCTSVLDKARIDEVEVDLCPRCGGLWLDHGEIERLSRKQQGEIDRLRRLLGSRKGPPPVPSDLTSSCPACTSTMREVKLGGGTLTIDWCTRCKGLFLDRGEIDLALKTLQDARATMPQLVAAAIAEAPIS